MAIQGALSMECGKAFPQGCGVMSVVTPMNDFDRSTRENPVQAQDKDSGRLMWQVDVVDFDPEARERMYKVKIIADQQPVPPDAIPGTPVRPVILEGLTVTPYIKEGKFPKIAYSLRCFGLAPANGASSSAAGSSSKAA